MKLNCYKELNGSNQPPKRFLSSHQTISLRLVIYIILALVTLLSLSTLTAFSHDEPIQLVRPATNHRDLELVESNLAMLRKMKDPTALVGVVGKFHSGKSFLMNQLMGKSVGFGIGPSVQPKTMGIWMWGKPLRFHSPKLNRDINLVFLDTEGFAATNVTENYDAKVFAVSTLLSSHLLYNSVKIIDQSDIDYLELLSRRTQLFALRSQLSKSKWTADFNHHLLSFPPLTWVVQDFVQETHNFETPTEWLHRLMGGHSRESDNYTISLLDIFEKVDCHTLFIPAFDRDLLTDLSQARDEDLSSDYKRERNQLIKKLRENVTPKEKEDNFVNGADLAQLLRVLVTAANDGSLTNVPSRWDTFVERLQSTASEDCRTFYDKELDSFLIDKNKNEPVSMRSFDLQHHQIRDKAFELLKQLLHGLDEAFQIASKDLTAGIEGIYLVKRDLNDKKIKVKCSQIKSRLELVAEEKLRKIEMPIKTDDLLKRAEAISSSLIKAYQDELSSLVDAETLKTLTETFKKSISLLISSVENNNRRLIENELAKIRDKVLQLYDESVDPQQRKNARKPSILKKIIDKTVENRVEEFKAKTVQFSEEPSYEAGFALFKQYLDKKVAQSISENENIAKENIKAGVVKFSDKFKEKIGTKYLQLPIDEQNLVDRLYQDANSIIEDFENSYIDFKDCCGYETQYDRLVQLIKSSGEGKKNENIKAYGEVVKDVLRKAKDVINISQDKYTNQYSFRNFVVGVASKLLSEGKSANWNENLKTKVIDDFIKEDNDIVLLMNSKGGLLASILGFIDYILSFLGL